MVKLYLTAIILLVRRALSQNQQLTQHPYMENVKSIYHSHPSGTDYEDNAGFTNATTIKTETSTTSYRYNQAPGRVDLSEARTRTDYSFGMRDRKVYIYNSTGVQAVIPMNRFVNFEN